MCQKGRKKGKEKEKRTETRETVINKKKGEKKRVFEVSTRTGEEEDQIK